VVDESSNTSVCCFRLNECLTAVYTFCKINDNGIPTVFEITVINPERSVTVLKFAKHQQNEHTVNKFLTNIY